MNPWVLLLLAILFYKLWQKVRPGIMDRYNQWQDARKEAEYAAQYHKNPDQFRQKMEAMDEARARLQDRYNQSTEEWVSKQRELEEKKRYKNRANVGEDKEREALRQQAVVKGKKGFKPEYNPLMGMGGGGSGYRPAPRRGAAGGGGMS